MTPTTSRFPLPVPGPIRRLLRGTTWAVADPEWVRRLGADWSDRVLDADATDRFHAKQGRSVARWPVPGDPPSLVVYLKRHNVLPRVHGLLAALFPARAHSPGRQEASNLEWARSAGLPVPRTLAAAEFLGPWGRLRSALAVEELTDQLALHEAVPLACRRLAPAAFAAWKAGLAAELARLSRELHRRRAFHKDLYLCHFYIREADALSPPAEWRGRVAMIDFHRLGVHPRLAAWWRVKDLAQLLYSAHGVGGLSPRDAARFWRAYRGGDWSGWAPPGALAARGVRLRWRNYLAQSRRRAARNLRGA